MNIIFVDDIGNYNPGTTGNEVRCDGKNGGVVSDSFLCTIWEENFQKLKPKFIKITEKELGGKGKGEVF